MAKQIELLRSNESNIYIFLARLLDFYRIHIFEVVVQFNAIFGIDNSSMNEELRHDGNCLQLWISFRLQCLLDIFEKELNDIHDCSLLNNLINQVNTCSQSLGSIGADFQSFFMDIVFRQIMRVYEENLDEAIISALDSLDRYHPMVSEEELQKLGIIESVGSTKIEFLQFPIIAAIYNGVNFALFNLSMCAPLNLCESVVILTNKKLSHFCTEMKLKVSENEGFREHIARLNSIILEMLVPDVFHRIYQIFDMSANFSLADYAKISVDDC